MNAVKFNFGLLLLLLLFYEVSICQKLSNKDSLFKVVQTAREDTNKVVTYLNYGAIFEMSDPDSAMWYYMKSWQLGKRLNYQRGLAMNISYQIVILNNKGKYKEALELCRQALEIYNQLHSQKDIAIVYNNLAYEYESLGELEPAIEYYLKSAAISEKLGNHKMVQC